MTLHRRQREQLRALCDELREDDGVDPRQYFKPARKQDKEHHKSQQLCRQVQKTVDLVLSGEIGDEQLNGLKILSVTPGADASHLLVTAATDLPIDSAELKEIERRLAAIQGHLRREVASAITRKKVPLLTWQLISSHAFPQSAEEAENP